MTRKKYSYYNCGASTYGIYKSYTWKDLPNNTSDILKKYFPDLRLFSNKSVNVFKHKKGNIKIIISSIGVIDYSYILYFSDETLLELHRDKGPALVIFNNITQNPIKEEFYINGIKHRKNGPQEITYFATGSFCSAFYRQNGVLHNEKKPAIILYHYSARKNRIKLCKYFLNGKNFRENDKSNLQLFDIKGDLFSEMWLKEEKEHRTNGPAIIVYKPGKIEKHWYINGERLDLRKFPAFENGKKINKVLLTNSVIIKAFGLNRDYGVFLKQMQQL